MDNWDEIRTAFQVARKGTVSGAAEQLGVHHATVIRHIDALEQRLPSRSDVAGDLNRTRGHLVNAHDGVQNHSQSM